MKTTVKTFLGNFTNPKVTTSTASTVDREKKYNSSNTDISSDLSINSTDRSTETTHTISSTTTMVTATSGDNITAAWARHDAVIVEGEEESPEGARDELFLRLKREAQEVAKREPFLCLLLTKVGLLQNPTKTVPSLYSPTTSLNGALSTTLSIKTIPPAKSFEETISRIVSHRLSTCSGGSENVCPDFLRKLIEDAFASEELEMGHSMTEAVREDALAIWRRDPACETLLEAVLFMKGFLALVIHRAARRAWKPVEDGRDGNEKGIGNENQNDGGNGQNGGANVHGKRFVALMLQSLASSAFGVDIHPAARIGKGVMIDHATGVVIGETATVGDGTTILHGVTLGGTGKESGDRHPKVGKDVLIGAGTKILGNIHVGDRAKIGAGSVVLRPIPTGATAVGSPARIIGFTPKGERPGSTVDMRLNAEPLVPKSVVTNKPVENSEENKHAVPTTSALSMSFTPEGSEVNPVKEKQENGGDTEGNTSEEDNEDNKVSMSDDEEDGGENVEGEEDDKVTDFGTPAKCCWVKPSSHNDDMCPFRNSFRRMSSFVVKDDLKDCLSHKKLRTLLVQYGCSDDEIVEVFFGLLQCVPASSPARQTGCIPLDIFATCFAEIAVERTHLDLETCEAIASGDVKKLGMSKKASKIFRSTFKKLGRLTEKAISSTTAPFLKDNSITKEEIEGSDLSEAIHI
mmetsp:Transcript_25159/g.51192  ORF Transcript_25159/g.51192 Transcript_25159/m.51192 type:complete len:690 (+) Transcript_25159:185-2254(+)